VDTSKAKRRVGEAAAQHVDDQVLGLGSGSTVAAFLVALADRIEDTGIAVRGVPTSQDTQRRCNELGIETTTLDEAPQLDLAIDGADEIDPNLDMLKGGGGALFREKTVAESSTTFLCIVDATKEVTTLGETFDLPVEVVPYAKPKVQRDLADLDPTLRLDGTDPFETDNGNVILDLDTGPIDDPHALAERLDQTTGILEHGLFLDIADTCLVGTEKDLTERTR
jgi:ribose 5-phosphate isomerase A